MFRPARLSQSFEIATGRLLSKIPPPTRQCTLEVPYCGAGYVVGHADRRATSARAARSHPCQQGLAVRAFAVCATAHFPHAAHCAPSAVRQQRFLRPRRRVPAWPLLRGANMSGASYAFSSSGANGSSTRSKSRRNCRRVCPCGRMNACGHAWSCAHKRIPVARLAHAARLFAGLSVRSLCSARDNRAHAWLRACTAPNPVRALI